MLSGCVMDLLFWPTWEKSSSADPIQGLSPACLSKQPDPIETWCQKVSAAPLQEELKRSSCVASRVQVRPQSLPVLLLFCSIYFFWCWQPFNVFFEITFLSVKTYITSYLPVFFFRSMEVFMIEMTAFHFHSIWCSLTWQLEDFNLFLFLLGVFQVFSVTGKIQISSINGFWMRAKLSFKVSKTFPSYVTICDIWLNSWLKLKLN